MQIMFFLGGNDTLHVTGRCIEACSWLPWLTRLLKPSALWAAWGKTCRAVVPGGRFSTQKGGQGSVCGSWRSVEEVLCSISAWVLSSCFNVENSIGLRR